MKINKTQVSLVISVIMFALQTFGVIPTADAPAPAPVPCAEVPNGDE